MRLSRTTPRWRRRARGRSRTGTSSSFRGTLRTEVGREFLERWLEEVLATPGLTGISERAEARRVLLEDALRAAPVVRGTAGPGGGVGSGGGSPRVPLPRGG